MLVALRTKDAQHVIGQGEGFKTSVFCRGAISADLIVA